MRRLFQFLALWFVLGLLVAGCLLAGGGRAESQERGAVAVCNWELFEQYGHDGYNWRWWGCGLGLLGQHQCRGGPNTRRCYTVVEAKREVRAFRAWTGLG